MFVLKLLSTLVKLNVQQELAYRADVVVNIFVNLMWLGWELLSLSILFSNTRELGGWGPGELITLLGIFRLVNTLMAALIWPNTERFNTGVRDGSLDYTLQLGSFSQLENAHQLRDRVANSFTDVSIALLQSKDTTYYRVQLGSFTNRADAEARARQVAQAGYSVIVMEK